MFYVALKLAHHNMVEDYMEELGDQIIQSFDNLKFYITLYL